MPGQREAYPHATEWFYRMLYVRYQRILNGSIPTPTNFAGKAKMVLVLQGGGV